MNSQQDDYYGELLIRNNIAITCLSVTEKLDGQKQVFQFDGNVEIGLIKNLKVSHIQIVDLHTLKLLKLSKGKFDSDPPFPKDVATKIFHHQLFEELEEQFELLR